MVLREWLVTVPLFVWILHLYCSLVGALSSVSGFDFLFIFISMSLDYSTYLLGVGAKVSVLKKNVCGSTCSFNSLQMDSGSVTQVDFK